MKKNNFNIIKIKNMLNIVIDRSSRLYLTKYIFYLKKNSKVFGITIFQNKISFEKSKQDLLIFGKKKSSL